MRLTKLQELDKKVRRIRAARELQDGYKEVNRVLHHQKLLFVPEIIQTKLISRHHDKLLVGYFGIDKTRELIGRKYYWAGLRKDVEAYIKGYNICLLFKTVKHKPYGNLQLLPIPTHR